MSPVSYIFPFGLGVFCPLVFIAHRVYRMYIVVIKAQKLLLLQGITSQAKGSYVKLVKNMCIFLLTVMSSELPGTTVAFYVWITAEFPPPILDMLMLSFGLAGPCIFSPIVCYYLNYEIQIAFSKKIIHIENFIQFIFENDRIKQVVVLYRRHSRVDTINNSVQIDILTIKDWKYWLINENLSKILFEYGNKNCSNENFLFFQEVLKVQQLSTELLSFIITKPVIEQSTNESTSIINNHSNNQSSNHLNNQSFDHSNNHSMNHNIASKGPLTRNVSSTVVPTDILLLRNNFLQSKKITKETNCEIETFHTIWIQLCQLIIHIYNMYIEVPYSPLEINISDICRDNIITRLKALHFNFETMTFPDDIVSNSSINERIETIHVISVMYNESLDIVSKIIDSDIFPRFKNTVLYEKEIKNYEQLKV